MKLFTSAIVIGVMSVVFAASAQTPAAQPNADPSAAAKEKLCRSDSAKCVRVEKGNKMRQAMGEACGKTPEACKERHEHALKRRQQTEQKPAGAEK